MSDRLVAPAFSIHPYRVTTKLLLLFAFVIAVLSPLSVDAQLGVGSSKNPFNKILDDQVGKLLGEELPVTLDAKSAYPTVSDSELPGGSFNGKPLQLTREVLLKPLSPGDYTLAMTFFCTEYGQHQPGSGAPYVLGPVQGKLSTAVATLLWRGKLVGKSPGELQMVSWAIQSSMPYSKMPPAYQKLIDQLLPDFKGQLDGQGFARIKNGYDSVVAGNIDKLNKVGDLMRSAGRFGSFLPGVGGAVGKLAPPKIQVPTLDVVLLRLGPVGRMAFEGQHQAALISANYVSEEVRQQTVFAGQGTQLPAQAQTGGPWSVKAPGRVYVRFVVRGGNLGSNNEMQIRVLPAPAHAESTEYRQTPHLQFASYQVAQASALTISPTLIRVLGGVVDEAVFAACVVGTRGLGLAECEALSITMDAAMVGYAVGVGAQSPIMAPSLPIALPMVGNSGANTGSKGQGNGSDGQKISGNPDGPEIPNNKFAKLAARIAAGHSFAKHVMAGEFKGFGIKTVDQFETFIEQTIDNALEEGDVKNLPRGRRAYWDDKTGTLVIDDPSNADGGTAFRPREGKAYYLDLKGLE